MKHRIFEALVSIFKMAKILLWPSLLILISVTSSSPITSTASGRCPDTWVVFGNSCYKLITQRTSWYKAQDICKTIGSSLVNIGSEKEDEFVVELAYYHGETVWIGLSDVVQEGQFVWTDTQEDPIYTHWLSGEPNNHKGKEDCAAVLFHRGLRWNDDKCDKGYAAVCEKPSSDDDSTASGRCPDTWVVFGKSCYKLIPQKNTWHEAQSICKSNGSSLVNIGSKKEDQFVVRLANNYGVIVWINLIDTVQDGNFVWADTKQKPTYTNWHSGEPNNWRKFQNCVRVWSGFWSDVHCLRKYAAVCEKVSSD